MSKILKNIYVSAQIILIGMCLVQSPAFAATAPVTTEPAVANNKEIDLLKIHTRNAPGNKAQILLEFSGDVSNPTGFALNNPGQMVFDFAGVNNNLTNKESAAKTTIGVMTGYNVIDSGATTRMIVDVINVVPYRVDIDRNKIVITLENDVKTTPPKGDYTISSIDFRRGDAGEGRVIIGYTGEQVPVNFNENAKNLIVEFLRSITTLSIFVAKSFTS